MSFGDIRICEHFVFNPLQVGFFTYLFIGLIIIIVPAALEIDTLLVGMAIIAIGLLTLPYRAFLGLLELLHIKGEGIAEVDDGIYIKYDYIKLFNQTWVYYTEYYRKVREDDNNTF